MRIVFCDDDPLILRQLQTYVKEFFANLSGVEPEYAVYRSGDELIRHGGQFDIAFLDVEMPGASGIHAGAKLKERNPRIKLPRKTVFSGFSCSFCPGALPCPPPNGKQAIFYHIYSHF